MTGNYFICENRVVIEGKPIGQFERFSYSETRDSLEGSAKIYLPVYAIGYNSDPRLNAPPTERIRAALNGLKIKPGAAIEVWGKYSNIDVLEQKFTEVLLFKGFIRQVISGFPSLLICEDNAFILRFGKVSDKKEWHTRSKLKDMVERVIPIANKAFVEYRKTQGFNKPDEFTKLQYDSDNSADTDYTLQLSGSVSPYEVLTKLINMYNFFSRVRPDGALYIGLGVADKSKRTIELHTQKNVIERDIIPKDGTFENYYVEVNSYDDNGHPLKATVGDSDGEMVREYRSLRTNEGVQKFAQNLYNYLAGTRNKGSVKTILYPVVELYDYVKYTDSLFSELSGGYYVTGKEIECSEDTGYIQTLQLTDERFMML